jgi:transposase
MNTQKDTYPNARTSSEWEHIMPYLPSVSLIGRPRKYEWRTVLDGIFFLLRTGCQWRYIPRDLGPLAGLLPCLPQTGQRRVLAEAEPGFERGISLATGSRSRTECWRNRQPDR